LSLTSSAAKVLPHDLHTRAFFTGSKLSIPEQFLHNEAILTPSFDRLEQRYVYFRKHIRDIVVDHLDLIYLKCAQAKLTAQLIDRMIKGKRAAASLTICGHNFFFLIMTGA
jgi:hypothetical protein